MARALGCHSAGTELSERRIAAAKQQGIEVLAWEDIPGANFDIINLDQVLEHVPDPLGLVRHLKSGLSPNGLLKFSVPSLANIERRVAKMDWSAAYHGPMGLMPVAPLEHINCFKPKSVAQMAKAAGMRRVFIPVAKQYQFSTPWSGPRQVAKNLVLPLYRNLLRSPRYVVLRHAENAAG